MAGVDLFRVADLKRIMASEKSLAKIMGYYAEHFAADEAYYDSAEDAEPPAAISRGVYQMCEKFGQEMYVVKMQTASVPIAKLKHGIVWVDERIGMFVWADDIKVGVFSIDDGKMTHYGRVTSSQLVQKGKAN